jgi:hypothetical protein
MTSYSNLPNLTTFKIEILASRVEILYDQILFLELSRIKNFKNKIWPHKIFPLEARNLILKVTKLGKLL